MTRYPSDTPLSIEAFRNSGWKNATESRTHEAYSSMWQSLSKAAQDALDSKLMPEGRALWLLSDASSMMLKPSSLHEPFSSMTIMAGKRSTLPEDFTAEDIEFLHQVYSEIDEPFLRARVSDILWLVREPKDPNTATNAIDAYTEVPVEVEYWRHDGHECWERAVQLCLMLKAGAGNRLSQIEDRLITKLLLTTSDDGYLPIWIGSLLHRHKLGETQMTKIASHLESLATTAVAQNDHQFAIDCLGVCEMWFERANDPDKKAEMTVQCADVWLQMASENPSALVATQFYENAIHKYRSIPRAFRPAHSADEKIAELRTKHRQSSEDSLNEMQEHTSEPIDISESVEDATKMVAGKALREALLALANVHDFIKFEKTRTTVQESMAKHPLSTLFETTHVSSDGRVIAKSPATDFGGGDADAAVWAQMVSQFTLMSSIVVQCRIWPALEAFNLEHRIQEHELVLMCRHSPIVPPGRAQLVGKALFAGLNKDFVTAIHLVVPQVEHLIRYHLNKNNVETTTIDTQGTVNEVGLSTLMENEEVTEIFDQDFTFSLKALFCDHHGPNLRNELAHGLLEYDQSRSVSSVYAWWLLLRIVFNTFWNNQAPSEDQTEVEPDAQTV